MVSKAISQSDFDEAIAWARSEVNSEHNANSGIGFEITDVSAGVSKLAFPDCAERLSTTFVKVALCPLGKEWPDEYSVKNIDEFKTIVRFILANPSLYKTNRPDGLDGYVSLSDCEL